MSTIWILTSEAPDDESLVDRNSLVYEVFGGQYENIRLLDELRKLGFNAKLLNPNKIKFHNDSIIFENQYIDAPDMAIIRATYGSDNKIVKLLTNYNIKFVNNFEAHLTCANKPKQLDILNKSNIDIPKTEIVNLPFDDNILDHVSFPIVVKPISSQKGEMVKLCKTPDDIYVHVKKIQTRFQNQKSVIFQEFIDGPTIVVWVVGGIPLDAQIRQAKDGIDFFISNNKNDGTRLMYKINSDLYNLIIRTTKALNIEIAKIDVLKSDDGYKICEVNSPGSFSGRDDCFNTNHALDIASYIRSIL